MDPRPQYQLNLDRLQAIDPSLRSELRVASERYQQVSLDRYHRLCEQVRTYHETHGELPWEGDPAFDFADDPEWDAACTELEQVCERARLVVAER